MTLKYLYGLSTAARIAAAVGLAALAGCASPPTHFYTLGADAQPTIVNSTSSPAFAIDMRPVKVPPAVARSQLVVQIDAAQVKVLEDDRWASPLPDEIRYALLAGVNQQAGGAPSGESVAHDADIPTYQIAADVQRFESWPGSRVLINVVWNVHRLAGSQTLTCRSVVSEPVQDGYQAMVNGHRRAIRTIATQIAQAVRAFSSTSTEAGLRPAATSVKTGKAALACPRLSDSAATIADRSVPRGDD